MNTEESIKIKYELKLPTEFNTEDFKKAMVEVAKECDETASIFKDDSFDILQDKVKEHFDSSIILDIIITVAGGTAIGLTRDGIKYLIKKHLLRPLQARFGRDVLKDEE